MNAGIAAKLKQLQALAMAPDRQEAHALRLLEKERSVDVVLAALEVLREREDPRHRAALLAKYDYCDANGARRDQGGVIRAAILKALRPIALPADTALGERAATTYEFLFGEAAGDLRAAGLLLLQDTDEEVAAFHSVRLLTDQYTSIMSGEPALTAARVLAAQRHALPLYAYVMREEEGIADVVAESLRALRTMPRSLLPAVVEKFRESQREIVLLGLFDLLLERPERDEHLPMILEFMERTEHYSLYRYLLIVLTTKHGDAVATQASEMAGRQNDLTKRDIWREVQTLRRPEGSGRPRPPRP